MGGVMNFLNDYQAGKMSVTEAHPFQKRTATPAIQTQAVSKPKAVQRKPVIDESCDDEYLSGNGWKMRGSMFIDPITRDMVIFEAAWAVQKERDRVLRETVTTPVQTSVNTTKHKQQQVQESTIDVASAILECDDGYVPQYIPHVAAMPDIVVPGVTESVSFAGSPVSGEIYEGMSVEDRLLAEAMQGATIEDLPPGYGKPRGMGGMLGDANSILS